jgi:serine/threonine protein phosphatase PrpC
VASIAGVRHRLAGIPVQDGFAWAVDGNRLVVAVADGLGGVPGSDTTATRAAAAAVDAVMAGSDPGADGVLAAMTTGNQTAQSGPDPGTNRVSAAITAANQAALGGGATTIVVAVLERPGDVSLARVGDSSAFLVRGDDSSWEELFAAPAADAIGSTTAALPADDLQPERVTISLEGHHVLVLATDGIADPWRDGPATVAPVLASALAQPPAPLELAQLTDFSRQGCHDDRTMLAVWMRQGATGGPPAG